jgi:hypothetical protein
MLKIPQGRVSEWELGRHKMGRPYSMLMDSLAERIAFIKVSSKSIAAYEQKLMAVFGVTMKKGTEK